VLDDDELELSAGDCVDDDSLELLVLWASVLLVDDDDELVVIATVLDVL
jgi:hypothetical protein